MPIVIPTAGELERMDKRQRAEWRKRMGIVRRQVEETTRMLSYGSMVQSQAEVWFRLLGPDPDALQHQAELLAALHESA
jgi:hypothetical protein